ncbi:MAG: ornithine cyclodeaminase family protein [Pseudomonadota bacterium]|nr:ornithine cyclodeaminase family protein [Pseudomonadota bacterium]
MKLRILTEMDVRKVIDMKKAIEIQKNAFALLSKTSENLKLRSFVHSMDPPGIAIFNPSFLQDAKGYGVKVVSDFFDNDKQGTTRMSSLMTLFDGNTGHPKAIMEGGYLTDLRTGAGTALAARYLAREESKTLLVIGAGRVARNQISGISSVCPINKVLIVSRTKKRIDDLMNRLINVDGWAPEQIVIEENIEEGILKADIVISATTAKTPTFPGSALKRGTFIAAVGANLPDAREVDNNTILKSSCRVIDSRRDCMENAGDFLIPINRGLLDPSSVLELSELVLDNKKGRKTPQEITFYKSIGVPIQDLVTAQYIEAQAEIKKIGTVIDIGGEYF